MSIMQLVKKKKGKKIIYSQLKKKVWNVFDEIITETEKHIREMV